MESFPDAMWRDGDAARINPRHVMFVPWGVAADHLPGRVLPYTDVLGDSYAGVVQCASWDPVQLAFGAQTSASDNRIVDSRWTSIGRTSQMSPLLGSSECRSAFRFAVHA